jgi:hypothetical protein
MSSFKLGNQAKTIRPFIGSKNFAESRAFYADLGFTEVIIDKTMSLFKVNDHLAFYLQDAYVKDWIENTMVFLEVEDVEACYEDFQRKKLTDKYKGVKLPPIRIWDWGKEIHLLDPAGVLWHFGKFNTL